MVRVKGRTGQTISVHMTGIGEVMRRLRLANKTIESSADLGVVKAGAFIEEEVKESIIGNRVETKSVDSGKFANSIEFTKTGKAVGIVAPKRKRYPKSKQTTEDIALFMEKGTSKIAPRRHFGNTEKRNIGKVKDIIKNAIKKGVI